MRWLRNPNGGNIESIRYKQGYKVDVDIPDQTWVEASKAEIMVICGCLDIPDQTW
ncbi:E2F transcription factor-like E2FE [Zea mays]|uniref:E2F transcription factor-like E2FE n=1 Tax=Zea mays TaxID=4577 RepID=A0A1D6HDF8_MAIZE|nr:E2F transcription factor-like E2FE [Zea mays]